MTKKTLEKIIVNTSKNKCDYCIPPWLAFGDFTLKEINKILRAREEYIYWRETKNG